MKTKNIPSLIFSIILGVLIVAAFSAFLLFVIDFHAFKEDFHKAYFPDYSQSNQMGCFGVGCNSNYYGNSGTTDILDEEFLANPDGQWASKAVASSSYATQEGGQWSASMATGKPDTHWYGDNVTAWAPLMTTGNIETLTLTFDKEVYATGVNIKETYGSGVITKVEVGKGDSFSIVWEGNDPTRGMGYFTVTFDATKTPVNAVRITLDTNKKSPNEWAEIDAVQLVGK